jgi:hypothetical protein
MYFLYKNEYIIFKPVEIIKRRKIMSTFKPEFGVNFYISKNKL